MGRWKQYQIEQDEMMARGYITPESGIKYLCSCHYSDSFLRQYIDENGVDGVCSYCGKHTKVLDLSDFIEYIGGRLADALEDVDNAGLFCEKTFYDDDKEVIPGYQRAGGYIAPDDAEYYESTDEVMEDFDLIPDNDALYQDVASCLYMERKIRRDPTVMMLSDELSFMWSQFERLVKGERRFTFFKSPMFENADPSRSDNGLFDILTELGGVIHAAEGCIPAGTTLYRCRPANEKEIIKEFKDITAPPVEAAKANRLSPVGISMFYGSYDEGTPYKEVKNYTDKPLCYIGSFQTTQDLSVVDLSSLKCSFWMPQLWQETLFLKQFHKEIARPLKKEETEVEYVPSQIFTEYLRYLCKGRNEKPYDGIIYSSSLTGERNVALFYDNKTTANILDLKGIKKYKVAMKEVIEKIKEKIADCERKGDMFHMPSIDRKDVHITETELEPSGSALYRCEYKIEFSNGDWIHIDYASKDKCRTFQVNPDRSVIAVQCSDSSLDFSDGWDERS